MANNKPLDVVFESSREERATGMFNFDDDQEKPLIYASKDSEHINIGIALPTNRAGSISSALTKKDLEIVRAGMAKQ